MKILKPGDPEFAKVQKEISELKEDGRILTGDPSVGGGVSMKQRDFPGFEAHYAIVPMGNIDEQVVFHLKKLSRVMMRRLNDYLRTAIFKFFGGVNPAEHIVASESPLGDEWLEYRSQYDLIFYRVNPMRSKQIISAVLSILEKFPNETQTT